MTHSNKLTIMDKLLTQTETLMDRFSQPYTLSSSSGYTPDTLMIIDDIRYQEHITGLHLDKILDKLKCILASPIQEETYSAAKQIVSLLYEVIQKWYFINIHDEKTYDEVLLSDYFQTKYEKNALMIYILHPFIFPDGVPQHTNQVEAKMMAKILSHKGYNVDIINTHYTGEIVYDRYDLIIGFGPRFDEACLKHRSGCLSICYLTESSPYFSNIAELKRLRAFEQRNHFLPSMERQATRLLDLAALMKADAAICLGNQQTVSTYQNMFHKIYPLNISGFSDHALPILHKSYPENRKNFLWHGGAGPIHKGLDLCIEAFRSLPDLHLSIVGELTDEFYQFYKNDIEHAKNISYHGFLMKDSSPFRQIAEQCGFCLFPSCSEGQSSAVLTTMFSGILPVCTKEVGIDIQEAGGFLIEDIRINHLVSLIQKLSAIDEDEFLTRQQQVYRYVSTHHTIEKYGSGLNAILDELISQ